MAIMYPKNIELYNPTESEKKVFKELKKQLPDDIYTVFYSVAWLEDDNGQKIESECDFLIFSEQDGFLTCEVKGGSAYKVIDGRFYIEDFKGTRELKRSPMAQAEESKRYFNKLYMEEYNEKFNGVFGSFSLFPFYTVDDPVLLDHRDKAVVLDINDMNDLEKKIKKIFNFYKPSNRHGALTKNQRTNFKNMINKKIAAKASASSIIEAKEYELEIVNRVQDNLVYFLSNYKRTFISGGAGTGKTWIASKFAKKACLEGKKVLITMHSEHLAKLFKSLFSDCKNIYAFSFDELVCIDGLNPKVNSEKLLEDYDKATFDKYDTVVVDEAQDFDQYQAMIISMHLKDDSSEMRVFYDLTQNIYDKDFKNGFDINLPPFTLRENLRNTSSIYEWATSETNLGKEVITNQIIGPLPLSYLFKNQYELEKYIESELVNLIDKENVTTGSITILTDHDNYSRFNNAQLGRWLCSSDSGENNIKVSLVEDFKGLESNIVFYIHNSDTPENYDYVAFTRAKYYLYDLFLKKV